MNNRWWWPFGRKETVVDPPRVDPASATYRVIEEERKLEDDKVRAARLEELANQAQVVKHRMDQFTAEMDRSFRSRRGHRHG
jgi:hypothetical protein